MNAFARCLVAVARQYVGPAAPAFLNREMTAIGLTMDAVSTENVAMLSVRVRETASLIMPRAEAEEFGRALSLADVTDLDETDEARSPDVATRILGVARDYLGPAAQSFVTRELAMIGTSIDEVTPSQAAMLAKRAQASAGVLMGQDRAAAFGAALGTAAGPATSSSGTGAASEQPHGVSEVEAAFRGDTGGERGRVFLSDGLLESARLLRANLTSGAVHTPPPPLMVLGTTSDHGCARVAASLSIVLAQDGISTVLVDANLRDPSLQNVFGVPLSPGLAEALEADIAILVPTAVGKTLSLVPAGRSSRSPGELVGLPRMTDIAGGLAARFDAVIYSVSGDPSYPDALLIGARAVRSAVLVIRLGHDTADLVRRAKDSLERAGVEILGYALLDNQTSFWAPKVSWTPWGKTGVGKVQSFAG